MFNAIAFCIVLLDGWGMIGIWTNKFGFHNAWEFWVRKSSITSTIDTTLILEQVYQAFYGLVICPWYSYSQIMISEVTPRGHEFLFFSLFSIIGKTSSFIGPLVSSAIIDASPTGNVSTPFYFLFALSLVSFLVLLICVDLKKSQVEQEKFLQDKLRHLESSASESTEERV